jgi:hypothetical protein
VVVNLVAQRVNLPGDSHILWPPSTFSSSSFALGATKTSSVQDINLDLLLRRFELLFQSSRVASVQTAMKELETDLRQIVAGLKEIKSLLGLGQRIDFISP